MDRREAILARIEVVLQGISGIKTVARNVVEFDETQLPAVSVLEGDEEVIDDSNLNRPTLRPQIITMTPQVYVRADGATVGTTINGLRAAIIQAILSDATLDGLLKSKRKSRYAGQQSTLHAARTMVGATALVFAITYVMSPDEL